MEDGGGKDIEYVNVMSKYTDSRWPLISVKPQQNYLDRGGRNVCKVYILQFKLEFYISDMLKNAHKNCQNVCPYICPILVNLVFIGGHFWNSDFYHKFKAIQVSIILSASN